MNGRCSGGRVCAMRRVWASGSISESRRMPLEKTEVKKTHADVFAKITAQYVAWNAQMLPNPKPPAQPVPSSSLNAVAEQYVKLVLAVGQHDSDYVDAFYGPAEWKVAAERQQRPLTELRGDADRVIAAISTLSESEQRDELIVLRREYLRRQLQSLQARVRM